MRDRRFVICAIILAVVIVLNLPLPTAMRIKGLSRDGIAPFQNLMTLLLHGGQERMSSFLDSKSAVAEREDLLTDLATLRMRVRDLEAVEQDNTKLRRQLGF